MAGAGLKHGIAYGSTDEIGWKSVEKPVHWYDYHVTVLHMLGIDHERLTRYHNGIQRRLTNVHGEIIQGVLSLTGMSSIANVGPAIVIMPVEITRPLLESWPYFLSRTSRRDALLPGGVAEAESGELLQGEQNQSDQGEGTVMFQPLGLGGGLFCAL